MRDLAKANATAQIYVDVPKVAVFRIKRTCWPTAGDATATCLGRNRVARGRCCFKRLRLCLGDRLGAVVTVVMDWLIERVGR